MLTDSNHSLAGADQKRSELEHMEEAYIRSPGISEKSLEKGEVFSLEDIDPALGAKMHLVNNVGIGSKLQGLECLLASGN